MLHNAARFVSDLVGNPEDRFSYDEAHIITDHEQIVGYLWGARATCSMPNAKRQMLNAKFGI